METLDKSLGEYFYSEIQKRVPDFLPRQRWPEFANERFDEILEKGIQREKIIEMIAKFLDNPTYLELSIRDDYPHRVFLQSWNKIAIKEKSKRTVDREITQREMESRLSFDDPIKETSFQGNKWEVMREDMINLGIYNSDLLNDILVNHDIPPVVDPLKPKNKNPILSITNRLKGSF